MYILYNQRDASYTEWAKSRYTVFFLRVLWMMAGNLSIEQRKWILKQ